MARADPFIFGVPLIPRAGAQDWEQVTKLLTATLKSVLAQEDTDFRLILAAHDVPDCWEELALGDERFSVFRADWPPARPTMANDDAGAKKWHIRDLARAEGGGLLMYLDADDLVDRRLVATARQQIDQDTLAGVVARGFAIDFQTCLAAPLPGPGILNCSFDEVCGSSTVGRLSNSFPDPFDELGSHHLWRRNAEIKGLPLKALNVIGGYVVNTEENHSERHGQFTKWRRSLNEAVNACGAFLSKRDKAILGITDGC